MLTSELGADLGMSSQTSTRASVTYLMTPSDIALVGEVSRQIGWEACAAAYQAAGAEMAAASARSVWRHPRHVEVAKARAVTHEPCARRCGRCSRCIHAAAYAARGGQPFLGDGGRFALTGGVA